MQHQVYTNLKSKFISTAYIYYKKNNSTHHSSTDSIRTGQFQAAVAWGLACLMRGRLDGYITECASAALLLPPTHQQSSRKIFAKKKRRQLLLLRRRCCSPLVWQMGSQLWPLLTACLSVQSTTPLGYRLHKSRRSGRCWAAISRAEFADGCANFSQRQRGELKRRGIGMVEYTHKGWDTNVLICIYTTILLQQYYYREAKRFFVVEFCQC